MIDTYFLNPRVRACMLAKMVIGGWKLDRAVAELVRLTGADGYDEARYEKELREMQLDLLDVSPVSELYSKLSQLVSGATDNKEWLAAAIAASALVSLINAKYPGQCDP